MADGKMIELQLVAECETCEHVSNTCCSCKYWYDLDEWGVGVRKGECMRMPPVALGSNKYQPNDNEDHDFGLFWPITTCDQSCGEFKLAYRMPVELLSTIKPNKVVADA